MKTGIALGGGGAKGFAHIGALRELSKAGIQFGAVAGTSIGALVGAVYASGNLHHLERESIDLKLTDIPSLLSPAWSLSGLFSGKNALELLYELHETATIEELKFPFAAVCVDLNAFQSVIFKSGDLRHAIRSSIAIPAIFTPVAFEKMLLVDGGLIEPLPIQTTRELGAEFVVAVDLFGNHEHPPVTEGEAAQNSRLLNALHYLGTLSSKLPWGERTATRLPSMIHVLERTLALSQRQLADYRLREWPADILIRPNVSDIGLLDFHRAEIAIERGAQAVRDMLPLIKEQLNEVGAEV